MREYQRILEAHGIVVEMLVTQRPGYIVYEGAYQVAAYPFADTLCGGGSAPFPVPSGSLRHAPGGQGRGETWSYRPLQPRRLIQRPPGTSSQRCSAIASPTEITAMTGAMICGLVMNHSWETPNASWSTSSVTISTG